MRARIVLLFIVLAGLWGVILARAGFLQLLPNERLKSLQKRQFETVVTLNPRRGDVLDRNGHELAVSMTAYSLFADPKLIETPRATAKRLAHELHVPVASIEEKLKNHRKRFVWLGRQLTKAVRDTVSDMKIRGLGFIEESERVYPNDKLLSQVLGFVGEEGQGIEGLELRYNDQLQALSKKVAVRRDARGRPLIVNGQVFNQVPDGADVELTIDRELQFILEQELSTAVREQDADSAVGVVLDAQTSEVLAMASAPTFDPNHAGEFAPDRRRDRAVTDSFEPGSVMKTVFIAGALANGLIEPNTKIDCENGTFRIGKHVIHEAEAHEKFGMISVGEILAHSSNIGATKIAFKLGEERMRKTLKDFGFGEKSGIDLPGEVKGIIQAGPWHEHLMANVGFGQGVTATPLQVANAYAAIANGGFLHQPMIVRAIRDHESGESQEMKPKAVRRVLTQEQVMKMRGMLLEATSDEGTGFNARVPGFPVAGKTGTAQKVNPNGRGYLRGGFISSFAGFIPANDPRFVIYVAVDHPKKGHFGGAIAAPLFQHVAEFAVHQANLAPVLINELAAAKVPAHKATTTLPAKAVATTPILASVATTMATDAKLLPDMTGLSLREVVERVNGTGLQLRVRGQGFVTRTSPIAGARVSDAKELTVFLEE